MGDTCVWAAAWATHATNTTVNTVTAARIYTNTTITIQKSALLLAVADGGVVWCLV
jgi:hypothetical protein